MNALASSAEEGRGTLRKAPGRCVQPFEPEMSEWGNPAGVISRHLLAEFIGQRRRTGGIETSQYPQEQKSNEILLVAASERGIAQTTEAQASVGL